MLRKKSSPSQRALPAGAAEYEAVLGDIVGLLANARRAAARSVNTIMTATYWTVGGRIVEHDQGGRARAGYGEELVANLARDLTARFGRGFSIANLGQMKRFYLLWPLEEMTQTLSGESRQRISQMLSGKSSTPILRTLAVKSPSVPSLGEVATALPLPWSHYVQLLSVQKAEARRFYEREALRGGWTVRQLARQIDSQFYERTALSKSKAAVLAKGQHPLPSDAISADEEIKDPLVLEFLGLQDEYSESELEDALVRRLETFLLELGNDFAFVGRQRRLRIDDTWYRVDLLFYHRRLRCLVIIDLKLGRFTHADAGQMHLYLNYAREHWTQEGENPPVGVILCSGKGESLVRYATDNLPNKLLVREYLTLLPDESVIATEIDKTRRLLEQRAPTTHAAEAPAARKRESRRKRS